ncbi:hypothetical protein [Croceicoccus bisphenolivorans]|uniref:hypothetical protein n=1 Tax=Croceicoccus bisphenolivorans TaxID=1783232 RepID=UPI000B0FB3E7|nr:hypothetical protein [Croceicoccus bisphenolivorans]
MTDEKEPFAYLIVKKDPGSPFWPFAFGRMDYIRKVKEKWASEPSEDEVSESDDLKGQVEPNDGDFTHQSTLTDALEASVDFGLAQHELIQAAVIGPLMIRIVTARDIYGPIIEEKIPVEVDEECSIYPVSETEMTEVRRRQERYDNVINGMGRFPSATLLSVVATFDTLIVDILSKMLLLQKDWLEKSNRTVPLSRLSSAESLEEIVSEQITEELYQFSRGSHSEQSDYIRKNFGVDIRKDWKRWPNYIEIFERRNLVAHGEKAFNKRYVQICTDNGHSGLEKILGDDVKLTESYLKQSLNILIEYSILLSFSLFRKFVKEDEDKAFINLNQAVFKLLQREHYVVAERLASYALSLNKTKMTAQTKLMLVVNRASALRHDGRNDDALKVLDEQDWTASSDLFKFCVSAVRDDVDQFIEMIPAMKDAGVINLSSILDWPCFSFMLKNPMVREKIESVFEVDLRKQDEKRQQDGGQRDEHAEATSEAAPQGSDDAGTVH